MFNSKGCCKEQSEKFDCNHPQFEFEKADLSSNELEESNIYIVGHSLGSNIVFDVIGELTDKVSGKNSSMDAIITMIGKRLKEYIFWPINTH